MRVNHLESEYSNCNPKPTYVSQSANTAMKPETYEGNLAPKPTEKALQAHYSRHAIGLLQC